VVGDHDGLPFIGQVNCWLPLLRYQRDLNLSRPLPQGSLWTALQCSGFTRPLAQTGRQTLENAIRLVESHPDWRARVVYGDTGACVPSMRTRVPGLDCFPDCAAG
jgi:hypothetical protein